MVDRLHSHFIALSSLAQKQLDFPCPLRKTDALNAHIQNGAILQ